MAERISEQFQSDLNSLKNKLLLMGGLIESMLDEVLVALARGDFQIAESIITRDRDVDQLEKQIDQAALEILALRQPNASDLRFVTSSFKICTDLERMGDSVVNICERIQEILRFGEMPQNELLPKMLLRTKLQISKALDAFVNQSTDMATEVLEGDTEIDQLTAEVYEAMTEAMKLNAGFIEVGMKIFSIAKHLERMSDHATNIAEQVVFVVKGLDIRHSRGGLGPTPFQSN
jgi:phosphate transport system protein